MENVENLGGAEDVLTSIIDNPGVPKVERDQAKSELYQIFVTRRQLVELDEIEKSISEGRKDASSKELLAILSKATDARVLARVRELFDKQEPILYWQPLSKLIMWLNNSIPYLAVILLLLITRAILFGAYRSRADKWVLADLNDSTNRNASGVIAHFFSHWAESTSRSVTSGLLVMEASLMPTAPDIEPTVESSLGKFNVSTSLSSSDLVVWGVNLGSLWRAVTAIVRWMTPQPMEVAGTIYLDGEKRLCARLTAPLLKHNMNGAAKALPKTRPVVAVSAVGDSESEEGLRRVSEEVTYKMLYALTRGGDVDQAESANELRGGLEDLRAYLSASIPNEGPSPWGRLEHAREIFEGVRKAHPEMLEAHIFEGIALDLLERHEDAAAHFGHVERETADLTSNVMQDLHKKAIYNGAVSYLRNLYALEPMQEAIARLERLVRDDLGLPAAEDLPPPSDRLDEKPLLALTLATLADAWANRTIQWRQIEGPPPAIEKLARVIAENQTNVVNLTITVQAVLDRVRGIDRGEVNVQAASRKRVQKLWGADVVRQVEWARSNALGDFYLYAAVEARKLATEQPLAGESDAFQNLHVEALIAVALVELRKCEMLLPAGVETLSNIGTLYLVRGEAGDLPLARQYLQRAIALNPHYEYAYYRLAQSWEEDRWRERVIQTLKAWPLPPQIPEFRRMFAEYFVEPKLEYPKGDQSG
jgi:tetratricopeptide (TPR) repeat protein